MWVGESFVKWVDYIGVELVSAEGLEPKLEHKA